MDQIHTLNPQEQLELRRTIDAARQAAIDEARAALAKVRMEERVQAVLATLIAARGGTAGPDWKADEAATQLIHAVPDEPPKTDD